MERNILCMACGERGHTCRRCPTLNVPPLGEMSKERHDDGGGEEDSAAATFKKVVHISIEPSWQTSRGFPSLVSRVSGIRARGSASRPRASFLPIVAVP